MIRYIFSNGLNTGKNKIWVTWVKTSENMGVQSGGQRVALVSAPPLTNLTNNSRFNTQLIVAVVVEQEERRLRERALDLRRQSVSAFKLMSDAKKDDSENEDEK
jgi:hypothetical protein